MIARPDTIPDDQLNITARYVADRCPLLLSAIHLNGFRITDWYPASAGKEAQRAFDALIDALGFCRDYRVYFDTSTGLYHAAIRHRSFHPYGMTPGVLLDGKPAYQATAQKSCLAALTRCVLWGVYQASGELSKLFN